MEIISIARQIHALDGEKMAESFRDLCKTTPGPEDKGKQGLKALYPCFFLEMIRTPTKGGHSFVDVISDPMRLRRLEEIAYKGKRMMDPLHYWKSIFAMYRLWYGSISAFRPTVARWLIQKYKPTMAVMDPCAGWGGRCLGAMSCGVPYIGVDTNENLKNGYERLARLAPVPVKMLWQPSETVDFSQYKYDMVLTSPPYWITERYHGMPNYSSKKDWLFRFLIPVFLNAYDGLLPGGVMAINFPEDHYVELSAFLGDADEVLEMPSATRATGRAPPMIYVWRKS